MDTDMGMSMDIHVL